MTGRAKNMPATPPMALPTSTPTMATSALTLTLEATMRGIRKWLSTN